MNVICYSLNVESEQFGRMLIVPAQQTFAGRRNTFAGGISFEVQQSIQGNSNRSDGLPGGRRPPGPAFAALWPDSE